MKQFFTSKQCLVLVLFLCLAKLSSAQVPYIVKDIGKDFGNAYVNNLTNANGTVFFTAFDNNQHGEELWRSDGTAAGTYLVKDINPGGANADIAEMVNVNGTVFFRATDAVNGVRLWKSDGTTSGTVMVSSDVSWPAYITSLNGVVYFSGNDSANGNELWKSDGTPEGTTLVKDINVGTGGSSINYMANINGTLYFSTNYNSTVQLWKSDGTTEGTELVKQFNSPYSDMRQFTNVNGTLFLVINDPVYGRELWKSDGTDEGTVMVKDINPDIDDSSIGDMIVKDNILYFTAINNNFGRELWKSDGTEAGTKLVKDIYPGEGSSGASGLVNVNGTFYFSAEDGVHGRELWKSDGTAEGTVLVKDIFLGSWGSFVTSLIDINGTIYFVANSGSNGPELWKSDGTPEGTVLVKAFISSYDYRQLDNLTNVNGKLYFVGSIVANTSVYYSTLWSIGSCTPANPFINTAEKTSPFNIQVQDSVNITCYCNVFNELITTVEAIGDTPVSGTVPIKEWRYPPTEGYYVPRQYELYPENDPDNAMAKITFYYTQNDFNEYNGYIASALKLPIDSSDIKGISSILIEKRVGTSYNDSGWPSTYAGATTQIDPVDADILWNSTAKRWEVSFETKGMGGYYLKTLTLTEPTSVTVSDTAICSNKTITLQATCASGVLNWYTSATGGSSIGTNSPLVFSPTTTHTYYAACEYGLNSTNRIATHEVVVTAMPTNPTSLSVNKTAICSGTTIELTATCAIGTVKWYNQASGGSVISTESVLQEKPMSNIPYYVACENDNCKTDRVLVGDISVTQQPTKPTGVSVDQTSVCTYYTINLFASCDIGTITWYAGQYDTTSIGTGNNLNIIPENGTSYYASCELGECTTERVLAGTVTIFEQPDTPTNVSVNKTAICSGTNITLSALCSIGTPMWYEIGEDDALLVGEGSIVTYTPAATAKYFVFCKNNICESDRVITAEVAVTTQPSLPTNVSASKSAICRGTSVSLSATCSIGTLLWYTQATGGTAIGTGTALSQSPTTPTTYYAECKNADCISARVATAEVLVDAPTTSPTGVSVDKTNICSGTKVTLSANCATGNITWYNSSTAFNVVGTGNNLTPTPSINTNYYASCENGVCKSPRIPTGMVTVLPSPAKPTALRQASSTLCKGSDFFLSGECASGTLNWYDSSTATTAIGSGEFFVLYPTTTKTYYAACTTTSCSSERVAMNEVKVYDQPEDPTGVALGKTTICKGDTVSLSGSCAIGSISWTRYGAGLGVDTIFTKKPDTLSIYFARCVNGTCSSNSISTEIVEVLTQPVDPTNISINSTIICQGDSVIAEASCPVGVVTWYKSATDIAVFGTGDSFRFAPLSTTTYYVACVNGICTSGRIMVNEVQVKPKPETPVISANRNSICNGESVTITASVPANVPAATLHWLSGLTGNSVSSNILPTVTTNYQVIATYDGCNSDSSAKFQITVNRVPAQPSISADNATICRGTSAILIAQCPSTTDSFYWSNNSALTNADTPGGVYKSTRAITEPGTYKGWCESNTGCKGPEKSITITAGTNCNGKDFITITPTKPVICPNTSLTLTAAGCSGTITWIGGASSRTGTSINISPTTTTTYIAQCSTGGFSSVDVTVVGTAVVMNNNISTGTEKIKALNTIESAKKIGDPNFTPAPVVTFEAGKSILLKPGFVADARSVFTAQIKGCN